MGDLLDMRKHDAMRARADAVIGLLTDWASWQQGYRVRLGYPPKSCGFSGGRSVTDDTASDDNAAADQTRNEIVDRCIDDLGIPAHKAAIHHRYLHAVYRMRDYGQALAEAHEQLAQQFRVKGVLW